uniref:LiaI-LiaF-like transmembrane region domain-containing protein n=1 Tax=candidate division WOR-3 bacterium TaxID=2052148 RepID=A0A7C2K5V4_UNCW3
MLSSGILLIIVGLLIWFNKMGLYVWVWRRDWPLILVIIGIVSLFSYLEGNDRFHVIYRRKKQDREEKED